MPHPTRRCGAAVVLAAAGALLGAAGLVVHAAAATSPDRLVAVAGVLPNLAAATPLGDADASKRVLVDLSLQRPDPAGEAALEHALYDPSSPQYHRFLTPAQYAARFGVPASTRDAARRFATAHGLQVVHDADTGDLLSLSGTVAQAEATFSVDIRSFTSQGTTFIANTTAPKVPASLGARGVIGLNDLLRSRTASTSPHTTKGQDLCVSGTCTGLTTPQDLWSIYDQPDSDQGQGQTMAIFGEGQTDDVIADLRDFEAGHGLRRMPVSVVHADGPDTGQYGDDSGRVEWNIDTQSSTGMAPLAREERLYFGQDLTDASTLDVLSTWVGDPTGPKQASASYGECEENPTSPVPALGTSLGGLAGSAGAVYTAAYEAKLQQAVNEGRTLFSSTGDTGSSCPVVVVAGLGAGNGVLNQALPVASYPASSPHVVAVGGTVLYGTPSTGTDPTKGDGAARALEYAWTFTGGGPSDVFDQPSYQQGIVPAAPPCTINVDGTPRTGPSTCRGTPDIAAQSGDVVGNGYAVTSAGDAAYPGGGTSLSSPLSMGMWTRVQAAFATADQAGLGFADETYYALAKDPTKDARDFFDVGGADKSQPSGNGLFTSLPRSQADPAGWDYVSGLGVPDVLHVVQDLKHDTDPNPQPVDPTLPTEPPASGGGGTTTVDPACGPVLTDAKGDDAFVGDPNGSGSNPQLDIVQGDVHTVERGGATYLQTVLTLADLSTSPASAGGAGNEYYVQWTVGSTSYFTNAEVSPGPTGPTVTYGYGTVAGNRYTTNGSATGTFGSGPDGQVVVEVPLGAATGAVAPGAQLLGVSASTKELVGVPGVGGSLQAVDDASGRTYVLGEVCQATGRPGSSGGDGGPTAVVPEAPRPALLLAGGGLGVAALVVRRRRRRAAA